MQLPSYKKISLNQHLDDAVAGITVALILVPQAIAYAQLAGLPPEYGLYASLLPPVVSALFGSSRYLATGPVALLSLIVASTLASLPVEAKSDLFAYAITLALLVGLIQLSLGWLRLGGIVNFISHPVIIGFSNAAAIIIGVSQISKIFGVEVASYERQYETLYHVIIGAFENPNVMSFIIAIYTFLAIIAFKKVHKKLPAILITVVITTYFSFFIGFEHVGNVVGEIPVGLPMIKLPQVNLEIIKLLFTNAFVIALLGFMESISISKSLASRKDQSIDPNRELVGQGLANISASLTQGYPVAGSFSRTAVNFQSGAYSRLSSLYTSFFVFLTLLFLTPYLYHLPESVLAVIIIFSVISLISVKKFREAWKTHRIDGITALITFVSTLFFAPELDKGIIVGVLISTGYYIYSRTHPRITPITFYHGRLQSIANSSMPVCKYIKIIRFEGSLFFASAAFLETNIIDSIAAHPRLTTSIILDGQGINYIDFTGIETLEKIFENLSLQKKDFVCINMKASVIEVLKKSGVFDRVGGQRVFLNDLAFMRDYYYRVHKDRHEEDCPLKKFIAHAI